jgi:hypothetical protein
MFGSSVPRRSLLIASLISSFACGCASEPGAAKNADTFDETSCDTSFEARASRAGSQRQARLSYGCAADVCQANEAFAAGTMQLVTIDVPSTLADTVEIASSDSSVIRTMSVQAALDPCLGLTRALVSLEARVAGEASLLVTAKGVTDELLIQVRKPAKVILRASPLRQFDLSALGQVSVAAGEPLLVVPSLQTASGAPLRGMPALSWSVADESLASVRLDAQSDDESFIREWAAPNAVFLDAKQLGTTQLNVRTAEGTEGSMTVNIISPQKNRSR